MGITWVNLVCEIYKGISILFSVSCANNTGNYNVIMIIRLVEAFSSSLDVNFLISSYTSLPKELHDSNIIQV